jgi:septum formation protein
MSLLQAAEPRLVLASASVARQALLAASGLTFSTQPAHIDEDEIKRSGKADGVSSLEVALLLAELKAERVTRRERDALVIGADQLLVCGDRWFDKPVDAADMRAHLQALRGKTHTLVTAMVLMRDGQRIWHHVSQPCLTMRSFSDQFIDEYIALDGTTALSSVGGYRLEGPGIHLFERIDGDHSAILGLPLLPLFGFLRQHGVLLD